MARKRNNLYDIATKYKKPGGISEVPENNNTRDPFIMGYNIGPQPGEGLNAPGWMGASNWWFANPEEYGSGQPSYMGPEYYEQFFSNWNVDNFGSFLDWWNNAPGAPGSGMDLQGYQNPYFPNDMDFYDWYTENLTGHAETNLLGWTATSGSNIGGPGDWGLGNMFTGTGGEINCDFLGPQYDNNGECYACCTSIIDECADGPQYDDWGYCISCCGGVQDPGPSIK